MFRHLARFYLAVAAGLTAWMWYVEFTMRNALQDHSLPAIAAAIATFPASEILNLAPSVLPVSFLDLWFTGPILLTCAAGLQVAALFGISKLEDRFFEKAAANRTGDGSQV